MNSHAAKILVPADHKFENAMHAAQRSMLDVIRENTELRAKNELLERQLELQTAKLERLAITIGLNRNLQSSEAEHLM